MMVILMVIYAQKEKGRRPWLGKFSANPEEIDRYLERRAGGGRNHGQASGKSRPIPSDSPYHLDKETVDILKRGSHRYRRVNLSEG